MADNQTISSASSVPVAADQVTYSGDANQLVQLTKPVMVTGAEGAKTVVDINFAEDAAHTSGDYGTLVLAKRTDAAAVSAGTDGDYATFNVDGSGRLWVNASGAAVPVTDNAGSLTVDGTVSVNTHDVTNAGTFAVQVSSALPAGANAIGKLAANSGVTIGDVNVISEIPGTGATNLGKAEDAVHTSADTGVLVLAVRRDAASSGVSADGDYATFSVDSNGALRVTGASGTAQYAEDSVASNGDSLVMMGAVRRDTAANSTSADGDNSTLSVNSTGALRVTVDSASTTALKADDAAFALTTDLVAVVGAVRDDALSSLAAAEGDAVVLRVNSQGALHVTGGGGGVEYLEDAVAASGDTGKLVLGVRRDAVASSAGTDGDYATFNLNASGRLYTSATVDAALPAGTNNIGDVDVLTMPGTGVEDAAETAGGTLLMAGSVRRDTAASSAGTSGNNATVNTDANGKLWVSGAFAEDAAATTADIGIAMLAVRRNAASSGVDADGDYANLSVDSNGALRVTGGGGGTQYNVDDIASATATGTAALAVRDDVLATLTEADGDESRLRVDSTGRLWANVANTVTVASHAVTNAGTFATQVDGAALTSLQLIDDIVRAEDSAHSSADPGAVVLGVRAASPTDRSAGPTDGDYEPFGVNEVGAVWVSPTHSANGGATTMNASSSDGATALTNSAQAIKASAGNLIGYYIYNPNASAQFVQFYNTASGSVTVGTTNPLFMLTIPATSGANLWMPGGIAFSTAISWSATSTAGGNGAPASALDAVAWYK